MIDLKIVETGTLSGSGGDLVLLGNDLAKVSSFENMPYLGMFGGNVEQDTPLNYTAGQQAFDWWGNVLETDPDLQFNSQTERLLMQLALTSGNLPLFNNAIAADLAFMQPFANITITCSIPATDVLQMSIVLQEPNNEAATPYIFIWDALRQDITNGATPPPNPNPFVFDSSLQYDLQSLI